MLCENLFARYSPDFPQLSPQDTQILSHTPQLYTVYKFRIDNLLRRGVRQRPNDIYEASVFDTLRNCDHMQVLTFHKLVKADPNAELNWHVAGIARKDGICKESRVSFVEVTGFSTWVVMAHELGHKYEYTIRSLQ